MDPRKAKNGMDEAPEWALMQRVQDLQNVTARKRFRAVGQSGLQRLGQLVASARS